MLETGHELRFDAVYVAHESLVRRALARHGVRRADLDDVVQETFVTVHKLLPTFEGRASVETWLHAVVWRVASGYHRQRRGQRDLSDQLALSRTELSPADLPGVERLHSSLERMQPDDRDLFALYEVGGLSIAELSELTGSSRATISERLERARKALGRILSTPAPAITEPSNEERVHAVAAQSLANAVQARELSSLDYEDPACCFSVLGDTVIARWRGETATAALTRVTEIMLTVAETTGGVSYLNVIEPTSRPPNRTGREVTIRAAMLLEGKLRAAAWATGTYGFAYLVAPIMNSYIFLSRTPVNVRFFREVPDAASWLARHTEQATQQDIEQRCEELKTRLDRLGAR